MLTQVGCIHWKFDRTLKTLKWKRGDERSDRMRVLRSLVPVQLCFDQHSQKRAMQWKGRKRCRKGSASSPEFLLSSNGYVRLVERPTGQQGCSPDVCTRVGTSGCVLVDVLVLALWCRVQGVSMEGGGSDNVARFERNLCRTPCF